jgi:hypothetical protein
VSQALPAPTSGHVAKAFAVAHAAPDPWSADTAAKHAGHGPDSLKHRTLPTALGPDSVRQLAGSDQIQRDTDQIQ